MAATGLLPWTAVLACRLPSREVAHHWSQAWVGVDLAITVGLAVTAWWCRRGDPRAVVSAAATMGVMCADAWFDLCTSAPGSPFAEAVVEAVVELLAVAGCVRTVRGCLPSPTGQTVDPPPPLPIRQSVCVKD